LQALEGRPFRWRGSAIFGRIATSECLLDPDVAGDADVGGRVGLVTVAGDVAVATAALRFLGPDSSTTLLSLPAGDEAWVVALRDGRVVSLLSLTVRDGRVEHIDGLVDPIKLEPIARALGTREPRPSPSGTKRDDASEGSGGSAGTLR
jgi:hypothetical protein